MGTQLPNRSRGRGFDGLWEDPNGNGWDHDARRGWVLVLAAIDPETDEPFTFESASALLDAEDLRERSSWPREQYDEPADLFESVPYSLSGPACVRKAA